MQKVDSKKGGFNLIELLVVMAIIAVLVALVIAAINIARRASRDTERRSNATSIQAALEDRYARNKKYPEKELAGLTAIKTELNDETCGDSTSGICGLEDPNGDNGRYCYKIGTPLEDNQIGKYVLRVTMESDGDLDPKCDLDLEDDSPYEDFSHE